MGGGEWAGGQARAMPAALGPWRAAICEAGRDETSPWTNHGEALEPPQVGLVCSRDSLCKQERRALRFLPQGGSSARQREEDGQGERVAALSGTGGDPTWAFGRPGMAGESAAAPKETGSGHSTPPTPSPMRGKK